MRFDLLALATSVLVLASTAPVHGQWTHRYTQVGTGHHVYLEGYELPTLTAGPMDPAPSPDGTRLAVAAQGWLWIIDLQTRVATQLTDGGAMDSRPRWSPEGSEIAFVRDDGADTWVVVKDLATGTESVAVDTHAIELDPSFAPDGAIWYASGETGAVGIWRLDRTTGERTQQPSRGRVSRRPQVTSDGSRLLFKQGVDQVVLRDLATGEDRVVFEGAIMSQMEPTLSPDGRRVVYQAPQAHGDGWELRLVSLERPGAPVLLAGGGDRLPLAPAWSADGTWIWFSEAGRDEVFRLYRVPATGGEVEEFPVASWVSSEPAGTLRLTTTSSAVEAPVPARVSVVDAEGHPLFPAGHQPKFDGQTGTVFFYSDGVVDLEVPAGDVTVSVARGLASPAVHRTMRVTPGTRSDLRVALEPVWDARAAGWLSGDQHFHLNYGGPYRLEPSDLQRDMAGEDLDVATPLVANLHERFGEQRWFGHAAGGQAPMVRFGQEVRSHFLGHIGLIGTDDLFWPWVWGPGYQVYGQDDRTNAEVTAHARAQGGLASYVHPSGARPFANPAAPGLPVELVADGVLGDVQALEVACLWTDELGTAEVWYHLLNLGWPVAATSGSDVMLNFYRTMAAGSTRTYVHTGDAADFDSYLDGLKAGRSFVTNGPLIEFTVDGSMPGDVTAADGSATWDLRLRSAVEVTSLEILVNGQVVETIDVSGDPTRDLSGTVALPDGGWVAARVVGPATTAWPGMDSYAFAHASPVWIGAVGSVAGEAERRSAEVLLDALAGARSTLEAAYAGAAIPNLTARFDEARAALEARLGG
jgi:TolB protein